MPDLVHLLEAHVCVGSGRSCPDIERIASLALSVAALADAAWDAVTDARLRQRDSDADYLRGRAHAFCEVLGDRDAMFRLLAVRGAI